MIKIYNNQIGSVVVSQKNYLTMATTIELAIVGEQ
jgi:hypothetical protein